MVSQRRGIHSKSSVEEDKNKQVLRQCSKCSGLIEKTVLNNEDNVEYDQVEGEQRISAERYRRRRTLLSQDLNETLCKTCADAATTQGTEFGVFEKCGRINWKFVVGFLAAITLSGALVVYSRNKTEKTFAVKVQNQTQDEIDFDNELYGLEDIYKRQEERIWFTFAAGIKSVIAENPNKPSVFLLLYDNDGAENTVKCLTQDVIRAASKYLMKQEIKPLIVAGGELNQKFIQDDPGRLLVLHKENVARKGAMIITNLEDVSPKVAASFHFFCDRYSPLVEKAIYLFTLKVKGVPKTPHLQKFAEDTLQSLWSKDLLDNVLHPLITRLTGNVLNILEDHSNC